MKSAYIIGAYSTQIRRHPDKSVRDLVRDAYLGVIADAQISKGEGISSSWFGNCMMDYWGQSVVKGQVCFIPLVREGLFPERVPMFNVEGGCATGSMAFHGAWKDVLSGQSDLSLAVGVEKLYDHADPRRMFELFSGGTAPFDRDELVQEYTKLAASMGRKFEPSPSRTLPMDTYALQAIYHMERFGTTREHLAACAAKNHNHAVLNPNAQYRFPMTVEEVLKDRSVVEPFTRAMCAPIGDGAAAALVCSEHFLETVPEEVRRRAVRICASVFTGGKFRDISEPSLSRVAADRAYSQAGMVPADIDVAEVHDATSFAEIFQMEMLRFCKDGTGGPFVASGATQLGGAIPVNTSGGLVSKGHPVGATGLSMIHELTLQLRHEAGNRQVHKARVALMENGGGLLGLEEAACAVNIFSRQ
jgi:acetyl-CoA acetyltransferase